MGGRLVTRNRLGVAVTLIAVVSLSGAFLATREPVSANDARSATSQPSVEADSTSAGEGNSGDARRDPTASWTVSPTTDLPEPTLQRPPSAVTIPAGASIQAFVDANPEGTSFILTAGTYVGQTIEPRTRNAFWGEEGAILDGDGAEIAFLGSNVDFVTIHGLEIRNYSPGHEAAAIRSVDGSTDWIISNNTISDVTGIALDAGTRWRVIENRLVSNSQYGIRGAGGDILVEGNEIAFNNETGDTNPYCCAGGSKFIHSSGLVLRGNYVHHNGGPGLWVDGYSIDIVYENNTLIDNEHAGIKHEISCDAVIKNNYAEGNGFGVPHWVEGGGIVVMNSPNVEVSGNTVVNNNDGIGGIDAVRDIPPDHPCPIELRNLDVHDNTIIMEEGHTGIATNSTSEVFSTRNNRFERNTYELGDNETYFRWLDGEVTAASWVAAGNDVDGSGLDESQDSD